MTELSNQSRTQILRTPGLWDGFDLYFCTNWQAEAVLTDLKKNGVDIPLVREWALWSFHPAEEEENEATQKGNRGNDLKRLLPGAITGCEGLIAAFSPYSALPITDTKTARVKKVFSRLVATNQRLEKQYRSMLRQVETTSVFATRRLGTNWNVAYLVLLKAYILRMTGWGDERVLSAITYLVRGAYVTLNQTPSAILRRLLQKAISHFEQNPQNATMIERIDLSAANPQQLYRMFPPLEPPRLQSV